MQKKTNNIRHTEQGYGKANAHESEISQKVNMNIAVRDSKTGQPSRSYEFKLAIVDEKTKHWQHTFWNIMEIARTSFREPVEALSNIDKMDAIMDLANELYVDPILCLRHIVWMSDRLRASNGFDRYCSSQGLNPDCVAQHIIFDGYKKVKAVIDHGVETVYGPTIALYALPMVMFDRN